MSEPEKRFCKIRSAAAKKPSYGFTTFCPSRAHAENPPAFHTVQPSFCKIPAAIPERLPDRQYKTNSRPRASANGFSHIPRPPRRSLSGSNSAPSTTPSVHSPGSRTSINTAAPEFTFSIPSPGVIFGPAKDDRINTAPTTHANRIGNRDFFIAINLHASRRGKSPTPKLTPRGRTWTFLPMRFPRAVLPALLLLWMALPAAAIQQMRVPFNFQWGESAQRVEKSLTGIKARIVDRRTIQNRTVLVVEGIPQKNLLRALFYFSNDALNEIELQYGDKTWDSLRYAKFFDEVRRNVDGKYGIGRMVAREKSRDTSTDVVQTLIGYQWIQGFMSLRLFLFTGEKASQGVRVLSLHYKEL